MLCVPTLSVAVVNVATPLPASGNVPRAVVPSMKVTVPPVGVPPRLLTLDVKVTGWL